jgi:hypothetical protein
MGAFRLGDPTLVFGGNGLPLFRKRVDLYYGQMQGFCDVILVMLSALFNIMVSLNESM